MSYGGGGGRPPVDTVSEIYSFEERGKGVACSGVALGGDSLFYGAGNRVKVSDSVSFLPQSVLLL